MTEGTIQQLQTLYMREENEITEACIKKKKKVHAKYLQNNSQQC